MNKQDLIVYLMDEYKEALQAIEAENAWNQQEDERLRVEAEENNDDSNRYMWRRDYRGRHVPKAELRRIRLMLQKAMLEVERQ